MQICCWQGQNKIEAYLKAVLKFSGKSFKSYYGYVSVRPQLIFACSKSTMNNQNYKTPEQCMKSVRS